MGNVPTDSILRRHYEQQRRAAGVPEDSILRRHHEQMRRAAAGSAAPPSAPAVVAEHAPVREEATPEPEAAPPSRPAATPASAPPAPSGGFLGWLKRLFGG